MDTASNAALAPATVINTACADTKEGLGQKTLVFDNCKPLFVVEMLDLDTGKVSRLRLYEGKYEMGRSLECVIHLPLPYVSQLHCLLIISHGKVMVQSLCTTNGTFAEGRRLEPSIIPTEMDFPATFNITEKIQVTVRQCDP